jgi:AcrR family transcriptional regulator
MAVAIKDTNLTVRPAKGPRARTYKIVLETALRLSKSGKIPTVSEVAEAADVSRATAYRYFPTQAALVQAVVYEALGPILEWESCSTDARERVADLFSFAYPRMILQETPLRASLAMALDERAQKNPTPRFRGTRRILIGNALKPLSKTLKKAELERLSQALSLVFGIESIVVLQDVWKLEGQKAADVARWAADALMRAALAEAGKIGLPQK